MVVGSSGLVNGPGRGERRPCSKTGNSDALLEKTAPCIVHKQNICSVLSPGNSDALLENGSMYFEGLCVNN
jgi:hypothetical protein